MSLVDFIGSDGNLLDATPQHANMLKLESPILHNFELEKLRAVRTGEFNAKTLPTWFDVEDGPDALQTAVENLCASASQAVKDGYSFLILSDRGVDEHTAPIPSLLATSAVHHHLVREGTRTCVGIIVESGEAREVMHFALLIGYGASAINPYLALETLDSMGRDKMFPPEITVDKASVNFIKAVNKGLLKTFAKMGISTLQSYRGAQIFEAIGLDKELVRAITLRVRPPDWAASDWTSFSAKPCRATSTPIRKWTSKAALTSIRAGSTSGGVSANTTPTTRIRWRNCSRQ